MLEFLKCPEWFARGFRQLCALQKPKWRSPALGLKHCAVRSLPVASLSSNL